jgi:hypothetical protein
MGVAIYSVTSNSGYNASSVDHTSTAGDNYAIVATWQKNVGAGLNHAPDTPGAPTYGGEAMTYVGTHCVYSGSGDANSRTAGVWLYVKHGIKAGLQAVTFTPTGGYRGSIGVFTGRWINPAAEDMDGGDNAGGGGYSYTITTTIGAMTVNIGTNDVAGQGPSGDGTSCWNIQNDEADNRWDSSFWCEYFVATGTSKTYDAGLLGNAAILCASWAYRLLAGNQVIWI